MRARRTTDDFNLTFDRRRFLHRGRRTHKGARRRSFISRGGFFFLYSFFFFSLLPPFGGSRPTGPRGTFSVRQRRHPCPSIRRSISKKQEGFILFYFISSATLSRFLPTSVFFLFFIFYLFFIFFPSLFTARTENYETK